MLTRIASCIAGLILLTACTATPPTPFTTGEEVQPPMGCIEYRKRGGEC